jgi:hypothetical protein
MRDEWERGLGPVHFLFVRFHLARLLIADTSLNEEELAPFAGLLFGSHDASLNGS